MTALLDDTDRDLGPILTVDGLSLGRGDHATALRPTNERDRDDYQKNENHRDKNQRVAAVLVRGRW